MNDTLGHPVGDALLKAVTERLRGMVRHTDTVARLGGDEFAIVQSSLDTLESLPRSPTGFCTNSARRSRSPGITWSLAPASALPSHPIDGADPDTLLKSADIALYQAKSDGRNRFRYFEPKWTRS